MIEVRNAIIKSVSLTNEDHGLLTAWLHLDYGGSGQGFGGYGLYNPHGWTNPISRNYCGHFIWRVLQIADVGEWNKVPGKTIRVRGDMSSIQAIGHILKDDWFDPKKDFAE
jgi:hypothetical protein